MTRAATVTAMNRASRVMLAIGAAVLAAHPALARERKSDPPLHIDPAAAAAALRCTGPLRGPRVGRPVLLVHGTGSTGAESWGWNYLRALPAIGRPACTIDLPGRSMIDAQLTSEYVVWAVRRMARRAHRSIDVVGHSQGGLQPLWALKWWPEVRRDVRRWIGIGTGGYGLDYVAPVCELGRLCPPAFWQLRRGSRFLAALRAGGMTDGPTRYTSIYSLTDEIAGPNIGPDPVGVVPGADNVAVQDLCPGRVVDHVAEVYDAAVFALVRHVLTHTAPVNLEAIDRSACAAVLMPGVDPRAFPFELAKALAGIAQGVAGAPLVDAEPPLAAYAKGESSAGRR